MHKLNERQQVYPQQSHKNKYNIKSRQADVQFQYHKHKSRLNKILNIADLSNNWPITESWNYHGRQSSLFLSAECPPLTTAPVILENHTVNSVNCCLLFEQCQQIVIVAIGTC